MRLTIHGFHILQSLILATKQQTGLNGTFHILPSLLRFSCLQTHIMARAYHIVHRTGRIIHRRQCRGRLLHHVIQFFHHIFHRRSGIFHHFAHHRITGQILDFFLFTQDLLASLVPKDVSCSHWSACYNLIRTSCLPIGQVFLFKRVPWSLDRHSFSEQMPPNIDMIGEQDLGALELQVGHGHVVYTGGAKGTDALVEEQAKHFGMQLEVLVPPNHPRATFITPSTVEVLMLANPHLHQAAEKLGKRMPSHFYTLQLLQRNYQLAKKAHTIYAFGILEQDKKRVKGGTGWTVQLAMDQGKPVYLFDIPSQSWYRSDHYYQVNENAATLVTGSQFVPWGPKKPTLHQSSAIVGSRDVDEKTRAEIQALFNRTFCLPENIDQLRMELEDFHL